MKFTSCNLDTLASPVPNLKPSLSGLILLILEHSYTSKQHK